MPDFFDTPVLLMFFVSMGKTIEAKARAVTAHSLSAVGSKSLPDTATVSAIIALNFNQNTLATISGWSL